MTSSVRTLNARRLQSFHVFLIILQHHADGLMDNRTRLHYRHTGRANNQNITNNKRARTRERERERTTASLARTRLIPTDAHVSDWDRLSTVLDPDAVVYFVLPLDGKSFSSR